MIYLLFFVGAAYASYCGDSAIPYSFEALPDGQPVLGCARPTCFGWSYNGEAASNTATFYRINRKPDGFLRSNETYVPPFSPEDLYYYAQQTAKCESTYQSGACGDLSQWVGGIAPLLNVSAYPTVLQCCTYEPLTMSTDRGIATVNAGQIVVGGEVTKKGYQYAFDYISDVVKIVQSDGSVSYDVNIRRFPCLPLQHLRHGGKLSKAEKAVREFNSLRQVSRKGDRNFAFQAPTLNNVNAIDIADAAVNAAVGPQPPANYDGNTNIVREQVVEETIAQPGVQLPPKYPDQPQAPVQQQYGQAPQQGQYPQPQPQGQYQQPQGQYPVPPPQTGYVQPPANSYAVAPQPAYYAPAAAPAYYGGSSGYYCFTDDTMITTMEGEKRMDELKVNDWVLTLNETDVLYSPVAYWLHRIPSQEAEFHKLTLEDSTELKLTAKHYIYSTECASSGDSSEVSLGDVSVEAVYADQVKVGDCVYRVTEDNKVHRTRVVDVTIVEQTGIYAPMTATGKIIVNGVYASCHTNLQSHSLQNTFFTYVEKWRNMYAAWFGESETEDLPIGMDSVLAMMDVVIPKNLVTY